MYYYVRAARPCPPPQVRIVPATTTGAQAGLGGVGGGVLPDFQVRHALYFNVSHVVRHLSFGKYFPGQHNPLDNTSKHSDAGAAEARYMIKVVPSTYTALNGSVTLSNLFSVTERVETAVFIGPQRAAAASSRGDAFTVSQLG